MKPTFFAAKYKRRGLGWTAVAFGSWALISSVTAENLASGNWVFNVVVGLVSIPLGVYFLRGQGVKPERLAENNEISDNRERSIKSATSSLASANGGLALVQYRKLENLLWSNEGAVRFQEILKELDFDTSKVASKKIGIIPSASSSPTAGTPIEVFNDWIIYGEEAFDTDSSTRGEVHLDGSTQIDSGGRQLHSGTSNVMFISSDWSRTFPIDRKSITEARRIVGQLSALSDSRKPAGVTQADIKMMIETILNSTGQPAAKKVAQLSDLRYQRLLTDQEFESAKAKVLGI